MNKDAMVGNANDPEQVKRAEKKEAVGRERELEDLRFVLSHPQGRRVLGKYLDISGVNRSTFSENTNIMLFKEGERNFGLRLMADAVEASQELYFKMLIETKEGK